MKKWSLAATGAALMIATASAGQDFAGLGTQIERGRLKRYKGNYSAFTKPKIDSFFYFNKNY